MPKFACSCNHVINLSNGSSEHEFALIPESCIERIAEDLNGSGKLNDEAFFEIIDKVKVMVYRCPSCGRLHVDGGSGLFNSFAPELPT